MGFARHFVQLSFKSSKKEQTYTFSLVNLNVNNKTIKAKIEYNSQADWIANKLKIVKIIFPIGIASIKSKDKNAPLLAKSSLGSEDIKRLFILGLIFPLK